MLFASVKVLSVWWHGLPHREVRRCQQRRGILTSKLIPQVMIKPLRDPAKLLARYVNPSYRWNSDVKVDSETTVIILACNFDLLERTRLQVNIITETNLPQLLAPDNFFCPFRHIDSYGSFGDRSSLAVLCDTIPRNSRLLVTHKILSWTV